VKILRLMADGFGPLKGSWDFPPDRVLLVVDDNERGKSSLLAAISAGLYGLDDDKRTHRMMTPIERWRPWQGGPYRVEIDILVGEERYTIRRDFETQSVQVMNGRGQDVTQEFRQGKDDYPVGQKLLGVDAAEFEKCALVRQGEMDQVVPGDEKTRRASTLHARLENAADTQVGDTNASEATQILEGALRRFTSPELETTGTLDNAIKAMEAKLGLLEADLAALEHERGRISGPLDELATLAEHERTTRSRLSRLDSERRTSLASDVRRQITADEEQRAALAKLREEVRVLESSAHLPANAEAELRETVARYEEAQRSLETLETRRRDEVQKERGALEAEQATLQAYSKGEEGDADRLVALAAEIRRVTEEEQRLRHEAFSHRDTLAGKGYEPERIQFLNARFGGLPERQQTLLRNQSTSALAYQTEVAGLEQVRTESTETLRAIDAQRNAQRMPGWFLVALGLGGAAAGAVILGMRGSAPLGGMLVAGGSVCILFGAIMLFIAARARQAEREDALKRLSEAQRRLNQLRNQRAETEVALTELSTRFSYRDPVELMREWGEYARLAEEFGSMLRPEEHLEALQQRRLKALSEVRGILDRVGGGEPDPGRLENMAGGIRRYHEVRRRLGDLERGWSWIDEEKRVAEALANGLKERATTMLRTAGLTFDPSRTWAQHFAELATRGKDRTRFTTLTEQLIPQAVAQLRPESEIEALRAQLSMIEAEESNRPAAGDAAAQSGGKPAGRSAFEIDKEREALQTELDRLRGRENELRLQIEQTWRRYHAEQPEKISQRERLTIALTRARRFKKAVELARDTIQKVAQETHRRWADHLNQRVTDVLRSMGTKVTEMRFGEDLDFSVRTWNGEALTPRGKAVLQLSSGARDQLHLAVRLAISEYLSRGRVAMPLLMDDPFATSDDERARAGMKLLLEHFSKRHQILVATCHRKRHETLAALDPELYAQRVTWLNLHSANVAG
jgi:hypothetical protein